VKLLLAHGCNVKAAAMDEMSALHFAAQKGHAEVVRHLLNAGAVGGRVEAVPGQLGWLLVELGNSSTWPQPA
jgi:ankyrin repeat protein